MSTEEYLDHEAMLANYRAGISAKRPGPYMSRAEAFLKWLGNRAFSKDNVLKWLKHLEDGGYASTTIHHDFSILKRLAATNDIVLSFRRDEVPKIHEFELFTPALAPEDINLMVDCVTGRENPPGEQIDIRPEHRAFLALSTTYGLRRVEMADILPDYLDIKGKTIFIETAKEGRQRYHLIPDNILPYLEEWGFRRKLSNDALTVLFKNLKAMIGFNMKEVGWHAIRRSAVAEAYRCGLSDPVVNSFYRWKRPMRDMALRYATAKVVSRKGVSQDLAHEDRRIDEEVLNIHPFVKFWD